ncbi:hypothetical protein JCM6882_006791 [Rhodosporidiobolus microsporus]
MAQQNEEKPQGAVVPSSSPATTAAAPPSPSPSESLSQRSHSSDSTAAHLHEAPTLFDLAHSRRGSKFSDGGEPGGEVQHRQHIREQAGPLSWRHLFKRPIVRQWLVGGVLAREHAERGPARFELFFDLVFVGIIHQLAERAAEESSSGWAVMKFIICFRLAWGVWQDVRHFINVSGTDDVPQRLYILLIMALLLGFSANASAIVIECPGETTAEEPAAAEGTAAERRSLFTRAIGDGEAVPLSQGCELTEGWAKNVRAALAFYLVAKLVQALLFIFYGTWLPRFRTAQYVRAAAIVATAVWWIPLTVLEQHKLLVWLPIFATSLELLMGFALPLALKLTHAPPFRSFVRRHLPGVSKHRRYVHFFLPAINVEHSVERMNLIIIIVLGEMILNITFFAISDQAGLHLEYLRSIFGLIIAYALHWVYMDVDSSRTFLHALRRNWFTAVWWQQLHFPLAAALVTVSVAMASLVKDDASVQSMRWVFGSCLAIVLVTLTLIATLNRPLDRAHSALIPRRIRLLFRFSTSIICTLLPLAPDLSSTSLLGVVAAVMVVLCIVETIGKLGSIVDEDAVRWATSVESPDGEGHKEENALEALERELGGVRVSGLEEGEYELTDLEKGAADAGGDKDLGELRVLRLADKQRMAYTF